MSHESAAIYAQVIPILLIAAYLGNRTFSRAPRFIRMMLFYTMLLVAVVEFALMQALATGEPVTTTAAHLAAGAVGWMLLLLVFISAVTVFSKYEPGDGDDANQDRE